MGETRDRMLRGDLYRGGDPENAALYARMQAALARFNDPATSDADRLAILREALRRVGRHVEVRPRLFVEYGNVSIGAHTFINVDAVMLDVCAIDIGERCQIASRVQLLTATHPIDPVARGDGWESGKPIVVEDNVWLGGGVIVCPGVTIGRDTVVGAGAVVAKDLPAGVVAGGVPARVIREIGPDDTITAPES